MLLFVTSAPLSMGVAEDFQNRHFKVFTYVSFLKTLNADFENSSYALDRTLLILQEFCATISCTLDDKFFRVA
jgi:hypothetical protein